MRALEPASLPSQRLLAAAPDPLGLPLVHAAAEAASLVLLVPGLGAGDPREADRQTSQQRPSQRPRPHWLVWLAPPTAALRSRRLDARVSVCWVDAVRGGRIQAWIRTRSWCALQTRN